MQTHCRLAARIVTADQMVAMFAASKGRVTIPAAIDEAQRRFRNPIVGPRL